MSPRHWRRVKRLFAAALTRPAAQREAWLAAEAGSAAIRAEVRQLLASLGDAADFLESPCLVSTVAVAAAARRSYRFAAGDRLTRYEILGLLGAGGMGEVYRARDTRLDRVVVLKVLPAEMAAHPEWRARLEREARLVSSLSHPHVCALYDIGQEGDCDFLVMEYLDGETLGTHLSRGALPIDDVFSYGIQIAGALEAAHRHGIVHRDLKPANVMLTTGGATLLDFGIARPALEAPVPPPGRAADSSAAPHTAPAGTAAYMAPEQMRGEPADARADVFALGAVLYEMATASRAFSPGEHSSVFDAVLTRDPPSMRLLRRDVPRSLERVAAKSVARDVRERYQSAADVRRDLESAVAGRVRRRTARWVAAAVVAAAACAGVWSWAPTAPAADASRVTLAVLPFVNQSGDAEQEYLSGGLTDELIGELARLHPERLSVIGHATVVRYQQTHSDAAQIGRDLGVDYVLAGTAARSGSMVRIDVRLTHAGDRIQVWTERYERPVNQLVIVRADVARSIAREVALALTPNQRERLDATVSIDPDAYEHYLKGRFYWGKRTERGLRRAVEEFDAAIQAEPRYAAAYAGLASSYLLLAYYAYDPPDQSFALARAASTRALELDDQLPDAHVSLAGIYNDYDHRWSDAEREYRAALRLDGSHATAHQWYANHLIIMGRRDEALAHIQRARELDPLSLIIQANVANIFLLSRQYERAIAESRKALDMEEEFVTARWVLGRAEELQGNYRAAAAEFERALRREPESTRLRAALARASALSGSQDRAEGLLQDLVSMSRQRHVSALDLASIQATLGQTDAAFASLERAVREHSNLISYLKVDPAYDRLRGDPRFTRVLASIGLE